MYGHSGRREEGMQRLQFAVILAGAISAGQMAGANESADMSGFWQLASFVVGQETEPTAESLIAITAAGCADERGGDASNPGGFHCQLHAAIEDETP